jgi:hypothetical protein
VNALHHTGNAFIVNLALADLCVTAVATPANVLGMSLISPINQNHQDVDDEFPFRFSSCNHPWKKKRTFEAAFENIPFLDLMGPRKAKEVQCLEAMTRSLTALF